VITSVAGSSAAGWSYNIEQDTLTWSKELGKVVDLGHVESLSLEQFRRHVHKDDRERFNESFKKAIQDGCLMDIEYRLIDVNGVEHWVIQLGITSKGKKDDSWDLQGILKEITDLKNAEKEASDSKEKMAMAEAEAVEANENLREFTYHASHDLHAPLRSIIGFSEIVLEEYSDKLDARGKDYLARVVSQSRHLEEMLNDLLDLSRIISHPINWQRVDLSRLASEIALRKKQAQPEHACEFCIEEGLTCMGDKELMETALECLLDNAFKFSALNKNAKVEFGKDTVGENQYFVRDNGIGFDMNYMDRLFKPFQRLHSSKDHPGNGIGLAKTAAIINKHGGRIWAESAVDQGTTFFFTLGGPLFPQKRPENLKSPL
jgi:light-regulated signal transduction histidine kinase (bacteriophytochrome)